MQDIEVDVPDNAYLDPAWVNEHAESLHQLIEQEIRNPKTVSTAAKRISLIMPRLIGREEIRQWVRLSESVLRKMSLDVNTRDPRRPEYTFDPGFVLKRLDHTTPIIQRAKRRRHRISPRKIYETYLILLMGLYYRHELTITPELIDDMLAFARVVNDQHIYHKLYQTLCVILTQLNNNERAILYGELALKYFKSVNNNLETALSAYALARAYYGAQDWELTSEYLEIASDLFTTEDYPLQYGAVAALQGCALLFNKQYEAAEQWLKKALGEYRMLGDKLRIASTRHYIGMAQAYDDKLDDAVENIRQAIQYYRDQGEAGNEGYTLLTLAFIQGKDGAYDQARATIEEARSLLKSIDDEAFKSTQLERAKRLLNAINEGRVHTISPTG